MAYALAIVFVEHHQLTIALLECQVNRFGKTFLEFAVGFKFIHHKLYAVIFVAVELHAVGYFTEISINPNCEISLLAQLLKQFLIVPFAVLHQRGKQIHPVTGIFFKNQMYNLLGGEMHHLLSRKIGIGISGSGIQQSQIVIHLSSSTHSASRVLVHRLLVD